MRLIQWYSSLLNQLRPVTWNASSVDARATPAGAALPPPHVHVRLQGEQQVGEEPLVHGGPLELGDAEHRRARAGAELPPLLLRHGHSPEPQIHSQVSLWCHRPTLNSLEKRMVSICRLHEKLLISKWKPPKRERGREALLSHVTEAGQRTPRSWSPGNPWTEAWAERAAVTTATWQVQRLSKKTFRTENQTPQPLLPEPLHRTTLPPQESRRVLKVT